MKKIILTGGGTAGHVTPNLALLPRLKQEGYEITYIGSKTGMEKELVENCKIRYLGISAGKLRRYLDLKNMTDAFRVLKGFSEAIQLMRKEKPQVVFSKGGFVTVPVVVAAKLCRVPVVLHESDMTPGLANRMSIPFATAICTSFPETLSHLPKEKGFLTGSPIRQQLFEGERSKGLQICNFKEGMPIILVMGGSTGSVKINQCVRGALDKILESYQLVHLCGKGNLDTSLTQTEYMQFEYMSTELPHILAMADVVVSRAGANSIFELLALQKPNLLIPLSKNASRGDQILNAQSFEKQGFSKVLYEEDLNEERLLDDIVSLYANRTAYKAKMAESQLHNGVEEVCKIIFGNS